MSIQAVLLPLFVQVTLTFVPSVVLALMWAIFMVRILLGLG